MEPARAQVLVLPFRQSSNACKMSQTCVNTVASLSGCKTVTPLRRRIAASRPCSRLPLRIAAEGKTVSSRVPQGDGPDPEQDGPLAAFLRTADNMTQVTAVCSLVRACLAECS